MAELIEVELDSGSSDDGVDVLDHSGRLTSLNSGKPHVLQVTSHRIVCEKR